MTIEECREYLPNGWTEIIWQDPLLKEIFEEHEYDLEQEAIPPFLFQDLRGGNIERLEPIFALYGESGMEMLEGLLEIDEVSKDTAEVLLPNGEIGYAGYFFARFSEEYREAVENVVRAYIKDINRIFEEEFEEDAPLEENAKIELLFGQEAEEFEEQAHLHWDVQDDLKDWDMFYQEDCEDMECMSEALYHINCDYLLSYYLQWSMFDTEQENPFSSYFQLWKMGLRIYFPERGRVVLLG